jgi:hypothetical protein
VLDLLCVGSALWICSELDLRCVGSALCWTRGVGSALRCICSLELLWIFSVLDLLCVGSALDLHCFGSALPSICSSRPLLGQHPLEFALKSSFFDSQIARPKSNRNKALCSLKRS